MARRNGEMVFGNQFCVRMGRIESYHNVYLFLRVWQTHFRRNKMAGVFLSERIICFISVNGNIARSGMDCWSLEKAFSLLTVETPKVHFKEQVKFLERFTSLPMYIVQITRQMRLGVFPYQIFTVPAQLFASRFTYFNWNCHFVK